MPNKDDTMLADERGFVLVGALLILLLLVLIGIAATTSTNLELQMAASHRARALGFYAAEAGLSFARASGLHGSTNVVEGEGLSFSSPAPLGANADQSFQGTVTYEGSGPLPRGSGFSDDYNAHFYRIDSTGRGPNNAETTVAVGAYRVGF